MQDLNRPKARAIALGNNGRPSDQIDVNCHVRNQRHMVITLGVLWILAFATGCSRNTKNCSAYDGVRLDMAAPTQADWDQN